MQNPNGIRFVRESLNDYLQEEVWEASTQIRSGKLAPEIYKISFGIGSPHNFSYWFLDKKLIHAETPEDEGFAGDLQKRLTEKDYTAGRIYYENIKHNKQKWYFLVVKQDVNIEGLPPAEVFVLFNYTPIRRSTKNYIKYAFWIIAATVLVSYLLGNWLVSRSMKYIEIMYQKQKQFVSDASHELRTPLSIMLSYAELLEYKPRDKKLIANIKEEILQLNRLIDNLLAVARYDNHRILLQREHFNLASLVKETASSVGQAFCRTGEITVSGGKTLCLTATKDCCGSFYIFYWTMPLNTHRKTSILLFKQAGVKTTSKSSFLTTAGESRRRISAIFSNVFTGRTNPAMPKAWGWGCLWQN